MRSTKGGQLHGRRAWPVIALVSLLLAACGSAAPSPSASTAAPKSSTAPASSAASSPSASSGAAKSAGASTSAASSSAASSSSTTSGSLQDVLIPYTAVAANMAPLWVGIDHNIFPRYGLKVSTVSVQNGTMAAQAMLGGSYQIAFNDGVSLVGAATNSDMVMVASIIDKLNFAVMVRPQITSVAQLKGKKIGVTGLGNATGFAAELFAERQGWNPKTDVQIVQIQTLPAIVAAMQTGQIDAGLLSHPTLTLARAAGMKELVDLWKEPIPFLHTGVVTTRSYIKSHRDVVLNVLRGVIASEAYMKLHPKEAEATIKKYSKVENPAALQETWSVYTGQLYLKVPHPSVAGAKTVIDLLGQQNPAVAKLKPESVVDDSLVSQLEKSGEIDKIYAQMK